ncbi:MAG: hypothetical protein Q9184_004836 [Pyrenodesmia sp. 2 TL-2023]
MEQSTPPNESNSDEGLASTPVSGKRRMTPTSMAPPPVPKKHKREPSPIRPSSPMDVEPLGDVEPPAMDDEPVRPATYLETKAKELSHLEAGLEYPPPEYNLEGKHNRDQATGRRKYDKEAGKILPYQLLPSVHKYSGSKYSNSVHQLLVHIQQEMSLLEGLSLSDGVDRSEEANALKAVAKFAERSAVLEDWDMSPRQQSLEARMEELLVKCGPLESEVDDLNLDFPSKRHCGSVDITSKTLLFSTAPTPQPGTSRANPPNPVAHMFAAAAQQLRQSPSEADTGVRVQHNLVSTLMLTDLGFSRGPHKTRAGTISPKDISCSSDPPADVPDAGECLKSTDSDPNPPTNVSDANAGTPVSGPRLQLRGGRRSPVPKDSTLQETALLKLQHGDPRVPLSREDRAAILAHLQERRPLADTGNRDVWAQQREIVRMLHVRIQRDKAIEAAQEERLGEESASRDADEMGDGGDLGLVPHIDLGPAESDGEEVDGPRVVWDVRRRVVSPARDWRSHIPAQGEESANDGGPVGSRMLATQRLDDGAADPPIGFGFEG